MYTNDDSELARALDIPLNWSPYIPEPCSICGLLVPQIEDIRFTLKGVSPSADSDGNYHLRCFLRAINWAGKTANGQNG